MNTDHYDCDPKESPTAQTLIQGEINALVSFWSDVRDDNQIGPKVAFDLLAIWAHMKRFEPSTIDETLVSRLNALVTEDQNFICEQVLRSSYLDNWTDIADRLDEAWDNVADEDEIDDLEHSISEHFELLDRCSLVVYAINRLRSKVETDERFQALQNSVNHAEEHLAGDPDMFLPAAVYASSMLDSYRHDLHDADELLWETTLKHRRLQELIDEQQAPSTPVAIPREVTEELIRMLAGEGEASRADTYIAEARPISEVRESTLSAIDYIVELPRAFNSIRNEFRDSHAASPTQQGPCETRLFAIEDDPDSTVRLSMEMDPADATRNMIFVELVNSSLLYTVALVRFSDGSNAAMEFDGRTGRVSVEAGIDSFQIRLVDDSGDEHILLPSKV